MVKQTIEAAQPAQVPGDAESPAEGTPHPTIERAVQQSDRTESIQSEQQGKGDKEGKGDKDA